MGFRRVVRSGFRKGRRVYKWGRKNPQAVAAMAQSAWRTAKMLKGIINSELKHKELVLTLGNNQSYIHSLVSIAQGDTLNNRNGNSILVKTLALNGYMYINASQTTNTRVMMALVRDNQQVSDTIPTIADIFMSDTDPHSLLNNGNLGRFKIMWRKQYTLDSNAAGNNARSIRNFTRLNFHVRYNATGSGDIQKNGLYLVFITSEPSMYPSIALNGRISYYDN